ncbi:vWA domain-containing protein [Aquisalinus flavus]|uniref:VWFA domain-containing protein n=1 Tax=Aquisalinus flavus TaxID=1526572 RepID=A0A8J2V2W5_9PROT|nr:VWA domain-containing protein [Aquisalinus flavus]MBD0426399.1 VWA domain-containing protein [Aquisalinus flavus]UNE48042.1 VWA domain-containing protein [Aquisalinus flavus]GGD08260.1 hypothetical protein GCM10011342_16370 [Aquisalinus flavus]
MKKILLATASLAILVACTTREEAELAYAPTAQEDAIVVTGVRMSEARAMMAPPAVMPGEPMNTEQYDNGEENPVKLVLEEPVSTFSADVDTSSYSLVRRALSQGYMPPSEAVRVEEMVNYFDYDYGDPKSANEPFAATVWTYPTPWDDTTKLMQIGVKGYDVEPDEELATNVVLLLDVSGSMSDEDKLPLLKKSLGLFVDQMDEDDTVSIVVYAGAAGVVLAPTPGNSKTQIMQAMDKLSAGGSTAGGQGIELAYSLAEENFAEDKVNRIILATDGDFNVGIADPQRLEDYVARKRQEGIYLTVLGFGGGNYNDVMMQKLAQSGNGIAAYIDTLDEARKVLVRELNSSMFPIANDLKFQVEFNPMTVKEYRLIGYQTRLLNREDFNDDKVDAGDIGSGHMVTAMYEITLAGDEGSIDPLRYSTNAEMPASGDASELAFLKMRYKLPGESESVLIEQPVLASEMYGSFSAAPGDAQFAAMVAAFGQRLARVAEVEDLPYGRIADTATKVKGEDRYGERAEFVKLVDIAGNMEK